MDIMVNKEDKVLISVHRVEAEDDIWEKLDNRRNLTKTAQAGTITIGNVEINVYGMRGEHNEE